MWGAGQERRQSHREPTGTLRAQAIDIFGWVYPGDQRLWVQVLRQRELDEETGDLGIFVEPLDDSLQFFLGSVFRKPMSLGLYPGLCAVGLLVAYVGDRGRILPHQDHVQPHRLALGSEYSYALCDLCPYHRGGGFAVKNPGHYPARRWRGYPNGARSGHASLPKNESAVPWYAREAWVRSTSVELIRFRRHDEVVLVQPTDLVRPPRDRDSSPLGQQRGVVPFLVSPLAHLVGEG